MTPPAAGSSSHGASPPPSIVFDCLWLVLICGILRVLTYGLVHGISSDEYFYVILAREFVRIGSGEGSVDVRSIDALHAPAYPLLLAAFFGLTESHTLTAARWLGVGLNILTVPAAYCLGLASGFDRRTAMVSALLLAIIPGFWRQSDRAWSDHLSALAATLYWTGMARHLRQGSQLNSLICGGLLFLTLFTKEYLLLPLVPAIVWAVIELRRRFGRRSAVLLASGQVIAVLLAIGLPLYCRSLPQSSYVSALHPRRGAEQRARHGPGLPDLRKLYEHNLPEGDFPLLLAALSVAGFASISRGGRENRMQGGCCLPQVIFAGFLIIFVSSTPSEFGARLLFPAFPVLSLLAAVALTESQALLAPGVVLAITALALATDTVRNHVAVYYSLPWFVAYVCAMTVALSLSWLAERTGRPLLLMTGDALQPLVVAGVVLVLAGMSSTCVIRHREKYLDELKGMRYERDGSLPIATLSRVVPREDITLSANPRGLAYWMDMNYAQFGKQGWFKDSLSEFRLQMRAGELLKRNINWIVLTRPELSLSEMKVRVGILDGLRYCRRAYSHPATAPSAIVYYVEPTALSGPHPSRPAPRSEVQSHHPQ